LHNTIYILCTRLMKKQYTHIGRFHNSSGRKSRSECMYKSTYCKVVTKYVYHATKRGNHDSMCEANHCKLVTVHTSVCTKGQQMVLLTNQYTTHYMCYLKFTVSCLLLDCSRLLTLIDRNARASTRKSKTHRIHAACLITVRSCC
jgi:hypothetical protein